MLEHNNNTVSASEEIEHVIAQLTRRISALEKRLKSAGAE